MRSSRLIVISRKLLLFSAMKFLFDCDHCLSLIMFVLTRINIVVYEEILKNI